MTVHPAAGPELRRLDKLVTDYMLFYGVTLEQAKTLIRKDLKEVN